MSQFNKSKGFQNIIMSPETHSLLIAEHNADLEYRSNILAKKRGADHKLDDGSKLRLVPSNHMLGACQVEVLLADGRRLGYSGDFGWPLDQVIQVDELVIDSTYGNPKSVRKYTQDQAESCLYEIVYKRLRHGSVHIHAHPGTIERVMTVIGDLGVPMLASTQLIQKVQVYQEYGLAPVKLTHIQSDDGMHASKLRSYVRLYSKGDGHGNEPIKDTSVTCSAYMVNSDNPLLTFSERAHRVALSNHADFEETMAYVEATGAKTVVTDNTRNNGCDLAIAIKKRFHNIHVRTSTNKVERD